MQLIKGGKNIQPFPLQHLTIFWVVHNHRCLCRTPNYRVSSHGLYDNEESPRSCPIAVAEYVYATSCRAREKINAEVCLGTICCEGLIII